MSSNISYYHLISNLIEKDDEGHFATFKKGYGVSQPMRESEPRRRSSRSGCDDNIWRSKRRGVSNPHTSIRKSSRAAAVNDVVTAAAKTFG